MTTATCAYCLRPVRVRADGKLARHNVTVHAAPGWATRRCSGSDRPAPTPTALEAGRKAAAKRTRDAVDKAWSR